MKNIQVSAGNFGYAIEATLLFTDFDPSGATAALEVGDDAPRAMQLAGSVARYVVAENDFDPGVHVARVRVAKTLVSLTSEDFRILVFS